MLEGKDFRNDILIGEAALRLAVDSFGRDGAPSDSAAVQRAKLFYDWIRDERKSGY